MIIRNAQENEIPFIREQRVKAYSEHSQSISEEHWQALKQAISSDADRGKDVELIVAELDGEIVGSVALFPANIDAYEGYVEELDHPEIRVLAVDSKARGKGIAVALVEECISRAKDKGYNSIGLHTADFMKSANKLYQRLDFERIPKYDFEPANDGVIVKAYRKFI